MRIVMTASIKALLLIAILTTISPRISGAGEPILTVEEVQSFYGLENVDSLFLSSCGDGCLIRARDGGIVLALFDASYPTEPLLTVTQAQSFYGLETVERLSTQLCGDSCVINAQNSSFLTIGIFDSSDPSEPLLTLTEAQAFSGLGSVDRFSATSCGDGCIIRAMQGNTIIGIFDASDPSQPVLTLPEAQSFYGLELVDNFFDRQCDDRCLIEARDGSRPLAYFDVSYASEPLFTVAQAQSFYGLEAANRVDFANCPSDCLLLAQNGSGRTIGIFKASDLSQPILTLLEAQSFYGLESVDGLSSAPCGEACLIRAQVGFDTLAIFDASGQPILTVAEAQGFYGLGSVDRLNTVASCGNECLIRAQDGNTILAYFDESYTNEPFFTVADAQSFYGLGNVDRLNNTNCVDSCFILGQDAGNNTIAIFDTSDLSQPVFTLAEAQAFYGLETTTRMFVRPCGDSCFVDIRDASFDILGIFDLSDTSAPLLTVTQAQGFSGLGSVSELELGGCGDGCLIVARNGFTVLGIFDASNTSQPLFTVSEAQSFPGLESVDRLSFDTCGDSCLIEAQAGSMTLALFDASNTSQPLFTVADAQSFSGLESVDRLDFDTCGDLCLIEAQEGNNTLAIFDTNGGPIDPCSPFPDLAITGLENLVACRGAEFCYELTISNPINEYQGEDSGNITVTGLLDTDWTVTEVIDCSNGDLSYTGPVGTVWTNPFSPAITFDESGSGTWNIGVLQPGESICLKLCGTDPDVGNKTLNIEVTQTP